MYKNKNLNREVIQHTGKESKAWSQTTRVCQLWNMTLCKVLSISMLYLKNL